MREEEALQQGSESQFNKVDNTVALNLLTYARASNVDIILPANQCGYIAMFDYNYNRS